MNLLENLNLSDYDYNLPEELIAHYPQAKRDDSRLLIYKDGNITDDRFYNLTKYFNENYYLIFNNTKVIPARIIFEKESGGKIEIFCLEKFGLETNRKASYKCLIGNLKKWKNGTLIKRLKDGERTIILTATHISGLDEDIVEFSWDKDIDFLGILDIAGEIPLPPYIKRKADESDKNKYQTIYAKYGESVAAPTAGLHFTNDLLKEINRRGIITDEVSLCVSAGTFKPIKTEIERHNMHRELVSVSLKVIENLIKNPDKEIVSIGTTTARTLESIYWYGVQILRQNNYNFDFEIPQWVYFNNDNEDNISVKESLEAVAKSMKLRNLSEISGGTCIFIVPGYRFRIVKHLITNFHQPKSTLLLLVSALIGDKWKDVYNYAIENKFRFLSYGDACFFLNK